MANDAATDMTKDTRHIGVDVPAELAEAFRTQCEERGFIQKTLLRRWIEEWVVSPESVQIEAYHRRGGHRTTFESMVQDVLRQLQLLPRETEAAAKKGKRRRP